MQPGDQNIVLSDGIDRILEVVAWLLLVVLSVVAVYAHGELPEIIPVHFDIHGRPDVYGDKTSIFILPVIGFLLLVVIHLLLRYSPAARKAVRETSVRAAKKYRIATRMIRIVKAAVLADFIIITATIWLVAMGRMEIPGVWFVYAVLGIVILPVAVALWRTAQQ